MILFIPLSMIPICICCSATIVFSILPFFWTKKKGQDNRVVFKKYFPFYAIVSFTLCAYGFLEVHDAIPFFVAAFLTSLQSWVWYAKRNITES